ncbi:MAG: hypothetical protein KDA60_22360 [Planctomycetales bacterium]|nr:hypothetical protein [Planctomycetales bacterium]
MPIREVIFLTTLTWLSLGAVNFNAELSPVIHTTMVIGLAFEVAIFACWGCYLVCLHLGKRENRFQLLGMGTLLSVFTCLALGLVSTRNGAGPHGAILPISVSLGMLATYGTWFFRRHRDLTTQGPQN